MPLIPAGRGRRITVELETSIVYRVNSRTQTLSQKTQPKRKSVQIKYSNFYEV